MNWFEIEKAFHRSVFLAVSKRKLSLVFPALVLSGLFIIFGQAVALEASRWIAMGLTFVSVLLSSGILLVLGVLLTRIHHHEAKQISISVKQLISSSTELLGRISSLAMLSIFAYLLLWMLLGIFFLLTETPLIGNFFSVVFSFGPFLLIFGSLTLCLLNLCLLFFVVPAAALQPLNNRMLTKKIFEMFRKKLFSAFVLFLIALIPVGATAGLLYLAAFLTNMSFSTTGEPLSLTLEWFFMMLPFSAILSPVVVFFFNFSAESYQLLQGIPRVSVETLRTVAEPSKK